MTSKFFFALNLFQMEDNLNILVNGTRPQKNDAI